VSRFESEIWSLMVGTLFGMLVQFRLWLDVDFFRGEWLVIMGVLVSWFVVRDLIMGRRKDGKSLFTIAESHKG
jgi:hypothetical protein